jgi:hypothetical protein
VIAVEILMVVAGLLVGVTFALNVGNTASGLASWHSRNAETHRQYYRLTDPWSLSGKSAYWRWFFGVFGAVFFVLGSVTVLATLGIAR